MHTASDAGKGDLAAALMERVETEFEALQKTADPEILKAAHKLAERFTCPMHPDVIGHKNEVCPKCGMPLGLNDDEVAFYDALAQNNSAVEAMGKDELKVIAAELVTQVRKSVTIDWTLSESARAKIKVLVKRILRKHGSPPDLEAEATQTVLVQAELPCAEWAET